MNEIAVIIKDYLEKECNVLDTRSYYLAKGLIDYLEEHEFYITDGYD